MKSLILAAGLLAVGATATVAQPYYGGQGRGGFAPWNRSVHPYEQRHHNVCQEKAHRLHDFERRAASDGRLDRRERRIIEDLRIDLGRTCGGFRHNGF